MDKCFCQKFFNWPPRSIFDDPHDRYSSALKFDSDRFLRPLEKPKPKIDSDRILSHLSREHGSHLSKLFDAFLSHLSREHGSQCCFPGATALGRAAFQVSIRKATSCTGRRATAHGRAAYASVSHKFPTPT